MSTKEPPGKYVRDYYQVPAYIGRRIAFTWPEGHRFEGKITKFEGQYLRVKFDYPTPGAIVSGSLLHPTWNIEYLESE